MEGHFKTLSLLQMRDLTKKKNSRTFCEWSNVMLIALFQVTFPNTVNKQKMHNVYTVHPSKYALEFVSGKITSLSHSLRPECVDEMEAFTHSFTSVFAKHLLLTV